MEPSRADRNLLIGILALQLDFISRDGLIDAMNKWVIEKDRSLDAILADQGALDGKSRQVLIDLVERHVELHDGDPARSLESVQVYDETLPEALHSIADSDLEASLHGMLTVVGSSTVDHVDTAPTVSHGYATTDAIRYVYLRPHAKGGIGQVSVAMDTELHREVALKEIQDHHADLPSSRARFVMEAEVTGGLEHPGIVPVYGLGTYHNGRPYYAMRFIRGDSLKEAVDEFHQSTADLGVRRFESSKFRNLLGRFVDVCYAVAYAHSRGVLHRDLKPGNIMLGKYGETLVVDWGLSKVVGRDDEAVGDEELTLQPSSGSGSDPTRLGTVIGTPQYMPPEQAAGRLDELGATSDVYSLGATLYYLLTSRPPFAATHVGELLKLVQGGKSTPPRSINSDIPKPLEAVCLKAMACQSDDRYRTPRELAEEIERWLADEPVAAYREPIAARGRRWIRQHHAHVAGIAGAVVIGTFSLIVLLGVVSSSNRQLSLEKSKLDAANNELTSSNAKLASANEQLDEANHALGERNEQLAEANQRIVEEEQKVRAERDVAEAINEFVRVDLLGQASPAMEPDRNVKLRTVLDRSAATIGDRFADQPLVEAAIATTIGATYVSLGEYRQAQPLLERARRLRLQLLGETHDDTLVTTSSLAIVYKSRADYGRAEEFNLAVLGARVDRYGEKDRRTMTSLNNLAQLYQALGRFDLAEQMQLRALAVSRDLFGDEHRSTLTYRANLAGIYQHQGRLAEAEPMVREVLEARLLLLGHDHPDTLMSKRSLANFHALTGRYEESSEMFEQTRADNDFILGESHPFTLLCKIDYSKLQHLRGKTQEAKVIAQDAVEELEKSLGEDHPYTLDAKVYLVKILIDLGQFRDAEPMAEQIVKLSRDAIGDHHPITLNAVSNLATVYRSQGHPEKAQPLMENAVAIIREDFPRDHPGKALAINNLAFVYSAQGRHDEAKALYVEAFEMARRTHGEDHPNTVLFESNLASTYVDQGRSQEALPIYERAFEFRRRVLGTQHPDTMMTVRNLAGTLQDLGRFDEAEPLLRESLASARQALGTEHPDTIRTMNGLATLLKARRQLEEARALLEEAVTASRESLGEDYPLTLDVANNLALMDISAGRYREAEPVLTQIYQQRTAELGPEHPMTLTSMGNLAILYHSMGKYDEALPLFERSLEIRRRVLGETHPATLNAMNSLAVTCWKTNRLDRSIPLFEECLAMRTEKLGAGHPNTLSTHANLGINYRDAGRPQKAAEVLRHVCEVGAAYRKLDWVANELVGIYVAEGMRDEAHEFMSKVLTQRRNQMDPRSGRFAQLLEEYGRAYFELKSFAEAEVILRECHQVRREIMPNSFANSYTMSLLGNALAGQGKTEQADELLTEANARMFELRQRATPAARRNLEVSLERMVAFCLERGQEERADSWQEKLDRLREELK